MYLLCYVLKDLNALCIAIFLLVFICIGVLEACICLCMDAYMGGDFVSLSIYTWHTHPHPYPRSRWKSLCMWCGCVCNVEVWIVWVGEDLNTVVIGDTVSFDRCDLLGKQSNLFPFCFVYFCVFVHVPQVKCFFCMTITKGWHIHSLMSYGDLRANFSVFISSSSSSYRCCWRPGYCSQVWDTVDMLKKGFAKTSSLCK